MLSRELERLIYGRTLKADVHIRQYKYVSKILGFFILTVSILYLIFYYLFTQS
jgi:hypothetical protein